MRPKNKIEELSKKSEKKGEAMFVTWTDKDNKHAFIAEASKALNASEPIYRTTALDTWQNIAPNNVSIRDDFSRRDYDNFRPYEAIPTKPKDIIAVCDYIYSSVGIIKNIIDMMADFASQGVDIVHRSPDIEKIYKEWFRIIGGPERIERFCNYLLRMGNVAVRRRTVKIRAADRYELMRSIGAADMSITDQVTLEPNEIPYGYTFLNVLPIDILGEELAEFVGQDAYQYVIRIPDGIVKKVKRPKNAEERALVAQLPKDMVAAILAGSKTIILDKDKVSFFYYKKDDWKTWAKPLICPILEDINMLRKMKLADLAALDGAISHIRLWRLGSLEHQIYPTAAAVSRLAEMLLNNVGGGSIDLIWGPELDLKETGTDVYRFLGDAKYKPVFANIYQGIGIPVSITGGDTGGGTQNNYFTLRNLIERIKYVRDVATNFLQQEIILFQKAMGFRYPGQAVFDRMNLNDEATELALLIQLADRDYISVEAIEERFGLVPEIEKIRIKREYQERKDMEMPPKASPYHHPQTEHELKKIALQGGFAAPSEVGLVLDEKKPGEMSGQDHQVKLTKMKPPAATPTMKGPPNQGRPKNSNDKTPRKRRRFKPSTSAEFLNSLSVAREAYNKICEVIQPAYLKKCGKKNLRGLTEEEFAQMESFKFGILCNIDIEDVNEKSIANILATPFSIPSNANQLFKEIEDKFLAMFKRPLTVEEKRDFQVSIAALLNMDCQDETSVSDNPVSEVS